MGPISIEAGHVGEQFGRRLARRGQGPEDDDTVVVDGVGVSEHDVAQASGTFVRPARLAATSSSTKNGLPPPWRWTWATRSRCASAGSSASISRPVSHRSAGGPRSVRNWVDVRARPAADAVGGAGAARRRETCRPAGAVELRMRPSAATIILVVASAQWRSSTTTSSGPRRAIRSSTPMTSSHICSLDIAAASLRTSPSSGNSRANAAWVVRDEIDGLIVQTVEQTGDQVAYRRQRVDRVTEVDAVGAPDPNVAPLCLDDEGFDQTGLLTPASPATKTTAGPSTSITSRACTRRPASSSRPITTGLVARAMCSIIVHAGRRRGCSHRALPQIHGPTVDPTAPHLRHCPMCVPPDHLTMGQGRRHHVATKRKGAHDG